MRSSITRWRGYAVLIALAAALVVAGATAAPTKAQGLTPDQLAQAGWTCIQPRLDPTLLLCAPPGVGLPPLPGTAGFGDRAPSYEFVVFRFASGEFIGTEHLLRPDIYERGKPSCPQQPGGDYIYNPRNDLWFCLRTR
jgi:hypothetical protein